MFNRSHQGEVGTIDHERNIKSLIALYLVLQCLFEERAAIILQWPFKGSLPFIAPDIEEQIRKQLRNNRLEAILIQFL